MSYEPTKWQTGDIITLNKLNKLEQGVAAMMEEYEPTVWQIGDTVTSTKLNKLEQAVATLSESGGGAALRVLQMMPMITHGAPIKVGVSPDLMTISVYELYVGSQIILGDIYGDGEAADVSGVAAGTTVVNMPETSLGDVEDISVFLVTFDDNDGSYSTVEPFDLDVSIDSNRGTISFVMPEWNATEGQTPVIYINHAIS